MAIFGLGGWRTDAQKIIILMGDAPPHDPEPITGLTHAQVVEAAKKAGVDTQQGTFAALSAIAADAGGQVFPAATASEVSQAILDAVGAGCDGRHPQR